MDTNTLRTFIALAQIKNFTKTAQQLFVAQSTVTNRIHDLETELGKELFVRTHKQVDLTPAGEKFLEYAQRFIDLEISAFQDLQSPTAYAQKIHIGSTNTIYECHLQKNIRAYMKANTAVSLNITISHTAEMLRSLQDGLLDVVFTYSALYRDGFICKLYRTDTLDLVCATEDTTYANGIHKEDLQKINYLFCNFALQGVGLYIQDLFPRYHHFPLEIDNSTKLPQYIEEGLGYSFLPHSLVEEYLERGTLRSIPLLDFAPPRVSSYFITKAPGNLPEDLEELLLE
ncbi:LysR family transcriptional regulator [Megasphaera hominis]|mgnify:FL=1|jgi:DNA-binding transcriptional LysR family regulator|uniref:LysR family transcriptional regulator n=2 Tax=Megasphaera TaxID=906 RepID=A0ABR6VL04_9FIRM|nr:LysR family transcriptional regulator [Megasphaera hominis]MBC3537972.1 LysR family transcriptional regulator [Megasphaera hominis]